MPEIGFTARGRAFTAIAIDEHFSFRVETAGNVRLRVRDDRRPPEYTERNAAGSNR